MDPTLVVAMGVTFLAVLGVGGAAYMALSPQRTAADRIAEFTGGPEEAASGKGRFGELAQSAARLAVSDQEQLAALRKRLLQAGYRERNAVEIFSALRVIGAIFLGVGSFLVFPNLIFKTTKLQNMIGAALAGAAAGYYLPAIWVTNVLQKRQSDLMKAFPDALDLLVSSVEAGLGIDAAFRRVAEEMENAAPELARELQFVSHEVNAGVPRVEALKHLADRTGLEEISQLVNVLVQAERFGTSVAKALRVHSDLVRTKRMQRAEEKAAQVSPKLTVIMILFILPCLVIILIGPAIINVKNILLPSMAGAGK
ncbi:MAG: type II secretion system F family protein [Myxococcota bacterium]